MGYIDGVPDHEQPWVAVCKNHCHLDGAPVFHNALKYSCNNYRFVMPKPRVFSRCRNGFIDVMELACHQFCVTGRHSTSAAEQRAAQFCKVYKSELPKPGAHQACLDGHAAGARAAHDFAREKQTEYEALKDATKTAQELETAREAARAAYEAMEGDEEEEEETETEEDSVADSNATEIDL